MNALELYLALVGLVIAGSLAAVGGVSVAAGIVESINNRELGKATVWPVVIGMIAMLIGVAGLVGILYCTCPY